MFHFLKEILHYMATLETQVLQILANQATILGNQSTIISNQSATLLAIQSLTPEENAAITASLATMETQLTDIQSQVDVVNMAATTPAAPAIAGATVAGTAS